MITTKPQNYANQPNMASKDKTIFEIKKNSYREKIEDNKGK